MSRSLLTILSALAAANLVAAASRKPAAADLTSANDPAVARPVRPGVSGPSVLRVQILLDRAHFSPGEIDGSYGGGTRKAIAAFQEARNLPADGIAGAATWKALNADTAPVLVEYTVAEADVAGPFVEIPEDMMEKAKLPAMSYESALEALAERFHASPKLLEKLNPGKAFDRAGETLLVPSVHAEAPGRVASIVVDKSDLSVTALSAEKAVLARYPASVGSKHDPLPVGGWKIEGVAKAPTFHYNPDLFWDAEPSHAKAKVPPGPNNPVGVVWIDLSKKHYGIHGTPEPSEVSRTQSHGCIRLTNWDAVELSTLVSPGTPAILQE